VNYKIVTWFIALTFVFDALNSIFQYFNLPLDRVSVFFRAIFELTILLIFLYNKRFGKYYLFILYLALTFLISYLLIIISGGDVFRIESLIILNKYFYFIALSLLFLQYETDDSFFIFINKALRYYLIINSALIIIGFAFNIELFSSYFKTASIRFGYKGLIPTQNETTGVYLFGLAYIYRRYFKEKIESLWVLLLITIAAILIGTKGIWISIPIIVGYYAIKYKTKTTLLISVPSLILIISIWGFWIWDNLYNNYLAYFKYFIERSGRPWYSIMLSGRDIKISESIEYIGEYWSVWNYIFGGINLSIINSETDLVDGYLLFGLNFLVYLFYYFGFFFRYDKSLDNLLIFLLFLLLSFTGGHMIYSAIIPLFYLLYVFSYRAKNNGSIREIS
jgi:hypothetical protein